MAEIPSGAQVEILEQDIVQVGEDGIRRAKVQIGSEPPREVFTSVSTRPSEIPGIIRDFDRAKDLLKDPQFTADSIPGRVNPRTFVRRQVGEFAKQIKSGDLPFDYVGTAVAPIVEQRGMKRAYRVAKSQQKLPRR